MLERGVVPASATPANAVVQTTSPPGARVQSQFAHTSINYDARFGSDAYRGSSLLNAQSKPDLERRS
jgi:hypothetical protein